MPIERLSACNGGLWVVHTALGSNSMSTETSPGIEWSLCATMHSKACLETLTQKIVII